MHTFDANQAIRMMVRGTKTKNAEEGGSRTLGNREHFSNIKVGFLLFLFQFGNLCHKISRLTSRPERDFVEKIEEFSRGKKIIFFNRCYQGSSGKYHYFLENMAISE